MNALKKFILLAPLALLVAVGISISTAPTVVDAQTCTTTTGGTYSCNGTYDHNFGQYDSSVSGVCYGSLEYSGGTEISYDCGTGPGPGGGDGDPTAIVLTANPTSIEQGHSSQLSWYTSNMTNCSIDQGIGSVATYGTRSVTPSATTVYTLSCTGPGGLPATDTATVTVVGAPTPLNVSCAVAPEDTVTGVTVAWEAFVDDMTGSTGATWQMIGGSGTTKICSGGSNTTGINNSCPDGISNGSSCSSVGTTCRVSDDTPSCQVSDGVVYGATTRYRCQATSASAVYNYAWTGTDGLTGTSQQVTKAYTTAGTKSGTVTVTSGTGSGSATCSTVVATVAADLTATAPSASSARVGQTSTITANVRNIGGLGAGASTGYFELVAPVSKNNAAQTVSVPAIIAGGSSSASFSYKFAVEGTHQVRLCADWYGAVAESNEGNNCGPWTEIEAITIINPNGVSCSVSQTTVNIGGSVTYTATPSGSVTAPYSWTSTDGATGLGSASTVTRTFATAGTYGMQVTGSGSASAGICQPVSVTACPGTPTANIDANPLRIAANSTVTLNWDATAINSSCTISGPGVSQTVSSASCTVPNGTIVTPPIRTQSTYMISCDGGAVTDSVIVNVIPNFDEF